MKFHFHKWRYYSERATHEQTRRMIVIQYPKHLWRTHYYRQCSKCGKVQGLDIDGWCDPVFRSDARKLAKKLAAAQ